MDAATLQLYFEAQKRINKQMQSDLAAFRRGLLSEVIARGMYPQFERLCLRLRIATGERN